MQSQETLNKHRLHRWHIPQDLPKLLEYLFSWELPYGSLWQLCIKTTIL